MPATHVPLCLHCRQKEVTILQFRDEPEGFCCEAHQEAYWDATRALVEEHSRDDRPKRRRQREDWDGDGRPRQWFDND